ncbi:Dabb family protein [Acidovorax sp. Leaf160]|uniref:Dabb family protein n=1 Tax=Acidovorax sp. Leaf160 TaxID=1736280 RepID=UPI0007008AF1|nr:Dabb family protein [Acidovorax sp. Leaf160]KQR63066.1 stress responsive protein [Acidovorax sp. Leaf160]
MTAHTAGTRPPQVRHIVLWRVAGETPQVRHCNAQTVSAAFEGLRGRIPGLLDLEIGIDVSGVDYACDVAMTMRFEDAASLERYAAHPEHLRVRQELGDLRTARHQVDYFLDPDQ